MRNIALQFSYSVFVCLGFGGNVGFLEVRYSYRAVLKIVLAFLTLTNHQREQPKRKVFLGVTFLWLQFTLGWNHYSGDETRQTVTAAGAWHTGKQISNWRSELRCSLHRPTPSHLPSPRPDHLQKESLKLRPRHHQHRSLQETCHTESPPGYVLKTQLVHEGIVPRNKQMLTYNCPIMIYFFSREFRSWFFLCHLNCQIGQYQSVCSIHIFIMQLLLHEGLLAMLFFLSWILTTISSIFFSV